MGFIPCAKCTATPVCIGKHEKGLPFMRHSAVVCYLEQNGNALAFGFGCHLIPLIAEMDNVAIERIFKPPPEI
jgi:hypothetical protein